MALDLSALRRIIADENRLLTGADIPAEYQSDVLGRVHGSAEALAFPLSTEEVSALLRYAHEHRVPVTPRGAGTNLVGSTVPLEGGIILDLSRMDRVLELDEDTMTVTVEPGMLLQDLQAYVEARGLFYPPDPGEKASSIGGNISTNAGGMRTVKYGVTRDYVLAMTVVLPDGRVMELGKTVCKTSSGYSLLHLMIGSEGTLGVITMEDVLEELVGDIWDEKDVVENEVVTRPDGGYELDGAMTLSDFLELLDWNEDALDDADSTTVGGWTLERFGTFPKVGDSFRYENLTVTVLAMDGRRVERVLVQPDPDADKDKDA